jgi:hypothetical protein
MEDSPKPDIHGAFDQEQNLEFTKSLRRDPRNFLYNPHFSTTALGPSDKAGSESFALRRRNACGRPSCPSAREPHGDRSWRTVRSSVRLSLFAPSFPLTGSRLRQHWIAITRLDLPASATWTMSIWKTSSGPRVTLCGAVSHSSRSAAGISREFAGLWVAERTADCLLVSCGEF